MSVLETVNLNFNSLCRTCLVHADNMNELDEIVQNLHMSLKELLLACAQVTDVKIKPTFICIECSAKLINAYNFKIKCETSDKILNSYIDELKNTSAPILIAESDTEVSQDPFDITENFSEIHDNDNDDNEDAVAQLEKDQRRCKICKKIYHKNSLLRHLKNLHGIVRKRSKKSEKKDAPQPLVIEENYNKKVSPGPIDITAHMSSNIEVQQETLTLPPVELEDVEKKIGNEVENEDNDDINHYEESNSNIDNDDEDDSVVENDKQEKLQCKICAKFYHNRSLLRHLRNIHKIGTPKKCISNKANNSFQTIVIDKEMLRDFSNITVPQEPSASPQVDMENIKMEIDDEEIIEPNPVISQCKKSRRNIGSGNKDGIGQNKKYLKKRECKICKKKIDSKLLLGHLRNVHNLGGVLSSKRSEMKNLRQCKVCKKYYHRSSLLRHLKNIHSIVGRKRCQESDVKGAIQSIVIGKETLQDQDLSYSTVPPKPETEPSHHADLPEIKREISSEMEIEYNADSVSHVENKAKDKANAPIENTKKMRQCELCKKIYHKGSLARHMRKFHVMDDLSNLKRVHTNKDNGSTCNFCGEAFKSGESGKTHKCPEKILRPRQIFKRKVPYTIESLFCHPNGTKRIECKVCSKTLPSILKLKQHLEQHATIPSALEINLNPDLKANLAQLNIHTSDQITEYISSRLNEGKFSTFYSITNEKGNEMSVSDSETDSDSEDDPHPINTYQCEVCLKIFDRRYKILFHQQNDHTKDELAYQCTKCQWKFGNVQLLADHLNSMCENEEKCFECDKCKLKFMWRQNVNVHKAVQHRRSSTNKGQFKYQFPCDLCNRVFYCDKHLAGHRKTHFDKKEQFPCDMCTKVFQRKEHYDRHRTTHLRVFECEVCQKRFYRRYHLDMHMRVHEDRTDKTEAKKPSNKNEPEMNHLCPYCGLGFRKSSAFGLHMRQHTGEKPFKCDLCGKGFVRSSRVAIHKRTHTGEKPYSCKVCNRSFAQSTRLVRHMRIHTETRPYKCIYCDRAFRQSHDLTIHTRRHTGDRPYVCGICDERFIHGMALRAHRQMSGHYESNQTATLAN